jgi:pimeloyl-ACP methyl ester carboxylesterase
MPEVRARGVRLHVQRLGAPSSPVSVVFLHGLVMDNLSSWYFTVANQAARQADVILYDLRGHGRSERPASGYGLSDMVADLDALLDALDLRRPVVLVGNSFGGLLALGFVLARPARVAGLVLVDAHLGDEQFAGEMAATLALQGAERDRMIADSFQGWLGRNSARKRGQLASAARALVADTSLVEDMRRTVALPAEALRRVTAPVLAIYGERSDLRHRGQSVLGALRACELVIVPGCSHSVLWEATGDVRRGILGFLERMAS